MASNVSKNKKIITIVVLTVVVIVSFLIILSGNFNGKFEFQIISNQTTGEPLGVLISLFIYFLMWLMLGIVPSSVIMLFSFLVQSFLNRDSKCWFEKGRLPKNEDDFEYAGKIALVSVYTAIFILMFLHAFGLVTIIM